MPDGTALAECPGRQLPESPPSEVTNLGLKPRQQVRVTQVLHAKSHAVLLDFSAIPADTVGVEEHENGRQNRESAFENGEGCLPIKQGPLGRWNCLRPA